MDRSIFNQVRQVAADIFEISLDELTESSSPDTIPTWDSMQHLNFVLALEQNFALQFEPEDIEQMKTIELAVLIVAEKKRSK